MKDIFTRRLKGLFSSVAVATSLSLAIVSAQTTQSTTQSPLESAWQDLAVLEPAASRAVLTLLDHPQEAIELCRRELQPLQLSPQEAREKIVQLADADPAVWKPAFEFLQYQDPRLAIDLPTLMTQADDPKLRKRLVELLLDDLPDQLKRDTWELRETESGEPFLYDGHVSMGVASHIDRIDHRAWRRAARAADLLAELHQPAATEILEHFASGNAEAAPTKAARAALERPISTTQPSDAELGSAWDDLTKKHAAATPALLMLAESPARATALIADHLQPLTLDPAAAPTLIDNLGSADEKTWRSADKMLRYYDPRLAIELPDLMDQFQQSPTRQRLVAVLNDEPPGAFDGRTIVLHPFGKGQFNFVINDGSYWAEPYVAKLGAREIAPKATWQQAARAILLLEHFHRGDATAIIRKMSTGHPDALPTVVANDALKRLGER